MSTVRTVLLEIKRRMERSSSTVPGETDLMGFLNAALSEMWRRGVEMNSPMVRKVDSFSVVDGKISPADGAARVVWVKDEDRGRILSPLPNGAPETAMTDGGDVRFYLPGLLDISFFPVPADGATVTMCYIPEFSPVDRGGDMPFPNTLDVSVVEWAMSVAARQEIPMEPKVALSRFLRGKTSAMPTGRPPW